MQEHRRRSSCLGRLLKVAAWALAIVVALLAAWTIVNTPPSSAPLVDDRLTERDLHLAAEAQHLRERLGDSIWPGFRQASLPLQLYNDRYGFVLGMDPPPGWETVAASGTDGRPYHRTAQPKREAFAVRIGDRWAGSISVKGSADAEIPRALRQNIGLFARLIPYRLFIPSTDQYVGLVLHEQFHAFTAERNGRRFDRALGSYAAEKRYPWGDAGVRDAWVKETDLLHAAFVASDAAARRSTVARFLDGRSARRGRLTEPGALAFEREVEWLEGLAKYVELASWRLAAGPGYAPSDGIRDDPQFRRYAGYGPRWQSERMSMRLSMNLHGDLPFYMSGALQAMVLDALDPAWKHGVVEGDLFLDDLLRRAIESPGR